MQDRVKGGGIRKSPARGCRPWVESLEGRQLLAASLAPISTVTVPANLGYQVPLDGSGSGGDAQTFTVASSNPDIKATVTQGQFLTMNISHTAAASGGDISFSGPVTFQLFGDLTPLTVSRIEQFVTSNFYNGKVFHRIASGFPGSTDFIEQGGSASGNGTGNSGQPGTPFVDEFNTQLAFTGKGQLAMANSGPDTNDTQFFITTGSPTFLNFHHTIFAQVVADPNNIVQQMTQIKLVADTTGNPTTPPVTAPASPVTITSATLSTTNPNGVIHVDATKAKAGESSNLTVTATDPTNNSTASQTFTVNTVADTQTERPFLQDLPYPTTNVTLNGQPAVVYQQKVAQNQQDIFQVQGISATPNNQLTYTVQGGVTTTANPTTGASTTTFTPVTNATATVSTSGVVTVTPTAGFSGTINLLVGVRDQVNRAAQSNPSATADDPANFDWHQIQLTVNNSTTPVALTPIALPITQAATANSPVTVQLNGQSANPATSTGLTYALSSQPTNGTISQFNATTGSLVYTPNANFGGTDTFNYTVTDSGTGTTPLTSPPTPVTINVALANTGAVRQIGNVLVVTPLPRTDGGTNAIDVSQTNDPTGAANDKIQVTINGTVDATQPLASSLDRIVVFGSKASDKITVEPAVNSNILVTLDGGHGGQNVLKAGAGPTREHGWFGHNVLTGGSGTNELVGRVGHVKFKPTSTTDEIFAGQGHPPQHHNKYTPPSGTFYKFVNGHLVPTSPGGASTSAALRSTHHPHPKKAATTGTKAAATPTATSTGTKKA